MSSYTIALKGDITTNWEASNRVLAKNEVGIERDRSDNLVGIKIGDGVKGWNELEYAQGEGSSATEINNLKNEMDYIRDLNNLNTTAWTNDKYIKVSDGKSVTSSFSSSCTGFINISGLNKLVYTRVCSTVSSPAWGCAFYTAPNENNESYINNEGETADGEYKNVTYKLSVIAVPNNANYVRFTWLSGLNENNNDNFAVYDYENFINSIPGCFEKINDESRKTNTKINSIDANIDDIKDDIDDIKDELFVEKIDTGELKSGIVNSTNGIRSNSTGSGLYTPYINVENYDKLIYTRVCSTAGSATAGCAFYTELPATNQSDVPQKFIPNGGEAFETNSATYTYKLSEIDVPNNAKYVRFSWNSVLDGESGESNFALYDYDNFINSIPGRFKEINDKIDEIELNELQRQSIVLGLHTEPSSTGQLNVIKRARQMTDIKWTPAVDLPRFMYVTSTPPSSGEYDKNKVEHYLGVFKAGKEYKGIPYGRCYSLGGYQTPTPKSNYDYGYNTSYVGLDVDFETFVTAVQSKQSIIAKMDFSSSTDHISISYAAVCSVLVNYALGLDTFYEVARMDQIPGLNPVGSSKIKNIDLSEINLGDVLYNSDEHVAIITDIVRDSSGNVTCVEVSEATTVGEALCDEDGGGSVGGLCRRVGFTTEDFIARFGEYYLRRYASISSVTYTPSKYVRVGDEPNMYRLGRLACMPYMGEGFVYKSDKIPNSTIVIENNTITENGTERNRYSNLRVFKDGIEISGSPFTVSSGATSVDVGFNDVGTYVAYLCNMENGENTSVTAKCHWSVIGDNIATGNDIDGDEVIGE